MRKAAIIAAIAGVALVLAILVVPPLLDVNRYHNLVQSELQKALARPVSFGRMHFSLAPPRLTLENLIILEDPAFGQRSFATIPSFHVMLRTASLWRGRAEVAGMDCENPRLLLERNGHGLWNFASLGQAGSPAAKGSPGISELRISGGEVALSDARANFRATYRNIGLDISGFAPGKPFDVQASVKLPGSGSQMLQLEGLAGPLAQNDLLTTPFDGKLQVKEVSLAALQQVLNTEALAGTDAVISGVTRVRSGQRALSASGSLKLTNAKVRGVEIGYPITAEYDFSQAPGSGVIRIERGTLSLGPTPLSVTGEINTAATPAQLNLAVKTRDASIAELARLSAALGLAFNAGMEVSGRLNADVRATGSATRPQFNGSLSAAKLEARGGGLQQPVRADEIRLALSPAAIQSNEFTAASGGTRLTGQFTLTNYSTAAPWFQATLRTANAGVAELLAIARAYGVSAAQGMNGTGSMTLNLSVVGPLNNASALSFSGNGALQNVSLQTASLAQPLVLPHANLQFSRNSLVLENLAASLAGTNAAGTLTLRNFAAPDIQFALTADKVDVARLQQALAGPATKAQNESAPLANLTGHGTVSADSLVYDQLALTAVKAEVTLDHGVIRFTPTTASLYKGQQSSSIVVDTRTTPMAVEIKGKLSNVDANALLSAVSPLKETLYGLLAANADTSFRASSSTDIARTLNGTLAMDLSKGRLARVNLMSQLAALGRFLGAPAAQAQPFTDLTQLSGTFNVSNGVARTNNLKAVLTGGSLAGAGLIDLGTQALNLQVTAILDRAMSQQVGGTQIGGFMQTALANQKGELVIPILVSGTLQNPRFAPDVQKLAQMKLQQMLPTAANPAAMTSGILGAILGQQGKTGSGKPKPGLGGILEAITGQQQPSQEPAAPPDKKPTEQQQKPQPPNPVQQLMDLLGGQKKQQQ